jgi:periplasmic divalent cation tolerance protein
VSETENDFIVVFCTAPPDEAEALAKTLVEERLAACVNISPVRSCYIWEGKLNLDEEALLIIKTTKSRFEPLKNRILVLHSYAIPEIIALPIIAGHRPYLEWMSQSE